MIRCGFKWLASTSYVDKDGVREFCTTQQECVLEKDHAGSHRSMTGVTRKKGNNEIRHGHTSSA